MRGWSQAKLAERLQLSGLDIGREGVAQIETQTHCIKDKDILYFAFALKVDLADLFFGNQNGRHSPAAVIALLQTSFQPKPLQKVVMKSLQPAERKTGKTEQNVYGCQRTQSNHGTVTKKGKSGTAGVFHPGGG